MKVALLFIGLAALVSCTGPRPAPSARGSAWKSLDADDNVSLAPSSSLVTYPSAGEWARIQKRQPPAVLEEKDE